MIAAIQRDVCRRGEGKERKKREKGQKKRKKGK